MNCCRLPFLTALLLALAPACANAAVLWDESVNGNFSTDQTAPTQLSLAVGENTIRGAVAGLTNKQDWLTVTVPQGEALSALILDSFDSTDSQGFMGLQAGTSFVGNSQTASPYLGYTHWGTAATNGSLPPTDLVGQDLLSLMADPAVAAGASGFTAPLTAGSYTFLIQQSGAATAYQLDFTVMSVPEPASLALLALAATTLLIPRRRAQPSHA